MVSEVPILSATIDNASSGSDSDDDSCTSSENFSTESEEGASLVDSILDKEEELNEGEIQSLVDAFVLLEGKDENVLEMLEDESLEQTKEEVRQELLEQSCPHEELDARLDDEMNGHIDLLQRRHEKLQEKVSMLLERLEDYVDLPKLYKLVEKRIPDTAITKTWKERSHWSGCSRSQSMWRYAAEEHLDTLGPVKRVEESLAEKEEEDNSMDEVDVLDDMEAGPIPSKVSEREYKCAVEEEKKRDAMPRKSKFDIRMVKEEDDVCQLKEEKAAMKTSVKSDRRRKATGGKERTSRKQKTANDEPKPEGMRAVSLESMPDEVLPAIQHEGHLMIDCPGAAEKRTIIDLSTDSEGEEEAIQGISQADALESSVRECRTDSTEMEPILHDAHHGSLMGRSIHELMSLIRDHGGNARGCLEKRDLICRLISLKDSSGSDVARGVKAAKEVVAMARGSSQQTGDERSSKKARTLFGSSSEFHAPSPEEEMGDSVVDESKLTSEPGPPRKRAGRNQCTICEKSLKAAEEHPLLHVSVCLGCLSEYSSTNFTKDSEGVCDQCQWCGKEGELYICENRSCNRPFCAACIVRNFGNAGIVAAETGGWCCFVCEPDSLASVRQAGVQQHIKAGLVDRAIPKQQSRRGPRKVLSDAEQSEKAKFEQKLEEERKARQLEWERKASQRAGRKGVSPLASSRHGSQHKVGEYDEEEDNPDVGISINKARAEGEHPVRIDPTLSLHLKPHQVEGVRFMWKNCIDSLSSLKSGSEGRGCILAHCMGLGKTFQVVTFVHTVLTNVQLGLRTVLVVVPVNVLFNWKEEFDRWQAQAAQRVRVYMLDDVHKSAHAAHLKEWQLNGGVFLIGYTKFRDLSLGGNHDKSIRDSLCESLQNPGADILVCDEAHMIKNKKAKLTEVLCQVKTRRRIALTGSPLQNNLLEYYYMLNFVREEHLGDEKAFRNRFLNPIKNGLHRDASKEDAKLMKGRIYALKRKVEGFLQRKGNDTLLPYLPDRNYYVIAVRLSPLQRVLYHRFLTASGLQMGPNGVCIEGKKQILFSAYCELSKVCNSPDILQMCANQSRAAVKIKPRKQNSDMWVEVQKEGTATVAQAENENAFGVSEDVDIFETGDTIFETKKENWWEDVLSSVERQDYGSGKLSILLEIILQAMHLKEKVLVFSHSLKTLDCIESMLQGLGNTSQDGPWKPGRDYFRIDGSVSGKKRQSMITQFNKGGSNGAKCFILSTKAGGLGINLVGANRVVLMDGSWNPTYDLQAIYRSWRLGQEKEVTAYRLLACGTMEEKLYNQQVSKEGLAARVLDQTNVARHFTNKDLQMIFTLDDDGDGFHFEKAEWDRLGVEGSGAEPNSVPPHADVSQNQTFEGHNAFSIPDGSLPKDAIMQRLLVLQRPRWIVRYHEHDNLLKDLEDERLPEEELKRAWLEVQQEIKSEEMAREQQQAGLPLPPS